MATERPCLDDREVEAFLGGLLDDAAISAIESHLDGCSPCRHRIAARANRITGGTDDDGLGALLGAAVATPVTADTVALTAPPALPALPALIDGQYRVVRPLGRGGMGVVYLARDVRLDREVAVKIGTARSASALQRVEREAVALARLQHPNVVVVHQVGVVDGRLYIAMEYVAGGNAREWRAAKPRTSREIVALYAAAGDGLAAAHAAGFVHRDFKPDNVLVGDDGRPRVADFGLVRGDASMSSDAAEPLPLSPALAPVTEAGAVLGTLAYMAPEQLAGDDLDARADQFAFACALWEALHGVRPFGGDTPSEVAAAIAKRPPRRSNDEHARHVPRHVAAALRRALAADRAARWPSMAALVAELRRDPARTRRVAIGAAVLAAAGGVTVFALVRGGPAPCNDAPAAIARVWSAARAERIAARFAAANVEASWRPIAARLDDYARAWAVARRDACRATRVDGAQSEALLDRRTLCLDRAAAALDAVVQPFERGDREAILDVVHRVAVLPDLDACADVERLAAQAPLPADPARRALIVAVGDYLSRVEVATAREGDFEPRVTAALVRAAAAETRWPPYLAETGELAAQLVDEAGDRPAAERIYRDAVRDALAGSDDAHAAGALLGLARDLAVDAQATAAAQWLDLARAEIHRAHDPIPLVGRLLLVDAEVSDHLGDPARELADMRELYDKEQHVWHDDAGALAIAHSNLALALGKAGQPGAARTELDAAIHEAEAAFGPDHPRLALFWQKAAFLAVNSHRPDDAQADAERAVALLQRWYGPEDASLILPLEALGAAQGDLDPAAARATMNRTIELMRKTGAAPSDLALEETNLAELAGMTGDYGAALAGGQRALAELEQIVPADSPNLLQALTLIGQSSRLLGQLDLSQRTLARAAAIADHTYGATNSRAAEAHVELAYTLLRAGRPRDAVAQLAPIMDAIAHGADFAPADVAQTRFAFASALWESGDHARGHAEGAKAHDELVALGAPLAANADKVAGWLEDH